MVSSAFTTPTLTATASPTATGTPRPTATPTASPTPTLTPLDYSQFPAFSPCTQDEDGGTVELWKCPFQRRNDFYVGGWVTDYLAKRNWNVYWKKLEPLDVMKQNGFQWLRTCATTRSDPNLRKTKPIYWRTLPWRDSYWSSIEYSSQILREGSENGYHLNLCLFLSDGPADAGRQYAPPEWQGLSLEDTAQVLEEYTEQAAGYFVEHGIKVDLYDIGNEVEWGILSFRPGERVVLSPDVDKTIDIYYMEHNVWVKEAILLKAAIAGIHRADPDAKTVIHIDSLMAFNNGDILNRAFFKYMVDEDVLFDYAGLSCPYPAPGWKPGGHTREWYFERFQNTIDYIAEIGKHERISGCATLSRQRALTIGRRLCYPSVQ